MSSLHVDSVRVMKVLYRIEEAFLPWLQQTLDLMIPYLPPPPAEFVPPSSSSLTTPIYSLDHLFEPKIQRLSISATINGNGPHANGHEPVIDGGSHMNGGPYTNGRVRTNGELSLSNGQTPSQTVPTRPNDPGGSDIKPSDWVWARLTRNRRVTNEGWWQNVREMELEFEDRDLCACRRNDKDRADVR